MASMAYGFRLLYIIQVDSKERVMEIAMMIIKLMWFIAGFLSCLMLLALIGEKK
tara:strand:- start:69 stop:230 length:162 start_codon:yes stop_codon:yes gene_type:complete